MQILLVGIIWFLSVITSLKGWLKLLIALIALFYKPWRNYALLIWVADDQDINALFNGNPDQSISGRVGYMALTTKKRPWLIAQKIINAVFFFQENHCYNEIEWDRIK